MDNNNRPRYQNVTQEYLQQMAIEARKVGIEIGEECMMIENKFDPENIAEQKQVVDKEIANFKNKYGIDLTF